MSRNEVRNETHSRVLIDAMLSAQGWNVADTNAVRFEVVMTDGTRADPLQPGNLGHLFCWRR